MYGLPNMSETSCGVIVSGSADEIRQAAEGILAQASEKFFLAADCTLPSDIDWNNIKTAIATAHAQGAKEA